MNLLKLGKTYKNCTIRTKVYFRCDYCGSDFERVKKSAERLNKIISKDSCGSKSCTIKKKEDVNLKIYGSKNLFTSEDFIKKAKNTNIKKYGSKQYLSSADFKKKRMEKLVERYGSDSPLKCKEIKEKQKMTCLERYGEENFAKTDMFLDQRKKTNIERYGCEFAICSDKVKARSLKKYGTEYPIQSPRVKNKVKQAYLKKYGVDHPSKSETIKKKTAETNLNRYGFKHASSSSEIKDKIKKTNLLRYGCECTFKSPYVQKKIVETNIERYGQPKWKFGKTQESIRSWLNSHGFNFISDFEILEGKELDCYDFERKFALEYCGLYWHNENSPQPRTRPYHHDKWKRCRDKGIQLITMFDDEWKTRNEVCKSLILSKLGVFERRIQARKCEVNKIEKHQMKEFCDQYHLQGGNGLSEVCFGLFHEDELVGVVDMGRHHRKKDSNAAVLTRLCFKTNLQIIGGAGKLFKACLNWFRNSEIKKIISWSDNRYSDGTVYKQLGFVMSEELRPDYQYVNMKNPKKRISKQSQSKKQSGCPSEMTELEWANSRGLSRIWDCGKTRWEFKVI